LTLRVRTITLAPGSERPFDEEEWRDALVVVEHGRIELASASGGSWQFGAGDMLWLSGPWLRALNNPGAEPAMLVAISRS
jgi:quercetin dioxygenase-like cupin family protein